MQLELPCLVVMRGFDFQETSSKTRAIELINAKVNNLNSKKKLAYLVTTKHADRLKSVPWTAGFLQEHNNFHLIVRQEEFGETRSTKAFINTRYSDASGANQTGGNGDGGDSNGGGQHRASLVDAATSLCAWRIEGAPAYQVSRVEDLTPYPYEDKSEAVGRFAYGVGGYHYARCFKSMHDLNQFKTKYHNDFSQLIQGNERETTLPIGITGSGSGLVGSVLFPSMNAAFDWLITGAEGLYLRKNFTPQVEMIAIGRT